MEYGPFNAGAAGIPQSELEQLKAAIIGGEVCANLAASDGDELLESGSGEPLLAYRKLDISEVINAGVSVALASAVNNIAENFAVRRREQSRHTTPAAAATPGI